MSPRPNGWKQLEDENRQAEEAFGRADVGCRRASRASVKKMVGPAVKREGVAHLFGPRWALSERRGLLDRQRCPQDGPLPHLSAARHGAAEAFARSRPREEALRKSAAVRPVAAGGRAHGHQPHLPAFIGEEGLTVRKRRARRRAVGSRAPILVESKPNARWSVDFVHDQLACGRRLRILNIVDDVTRECLAAIPDTSISGRRVARELTVLIERRGFGNPA